MADAHSNLAAAKMCLSQLLVAIQYSNPQKDSAPIQSHIAITYCEVNVCALIGISCARLAGFSYVACVAQFPRPKPLLATTAG